MKRALVLSIIGLSLLATSAAAAARPRINWSPDVRSQVYLQEWDIVTSPAANAVQFDAPASCTTDWRGISDCTLPDEGVASDHTSCHRHGPLRLDCPVDLWLGTHTNIVGTATISVRQTRHGLRATWWWVNRPKAL